MGSKGCTNSKTLFSQSGQVQTRSLEVIKYSHFCNNSGYNDANSSAVLLDQLLGPNEGFLMGRHMVGAAVRSQAVHLNLLIVL